MAKTKYQEAAMQYVKHYIDKLLDMQSPVKRKVDKHPNQADKKQKP